MSNKQLVNFLTKMSKPTLKIIIWELAKDGNYGKALLSLWVLVIR